MIQALLAHESQHPDVDGMIERVRGWVALNGKAAGFDDGRSAEAFRVVETG